MTLASDDALLSAKKASALASISRQRLAYWDRTGLITPSITRKISTRNVVRLYGFDRLVELLVASALVHKPGISLQHLRKVVERLRDEDYVAPLRELRFAVDGPEVYFQHHDGTWEGSRKRWQTVAHEVLELEEIRAIVREAMSRDQHSHGRIERRRGTLGSEPVIAGTRVPVSSVQAFIEAGASDKRIMGAYPSLEQADIDAVRALASSRAS